MYKSEKIEAWESSRKDIFVERFAERRKAQGFRTLKQLADSLEVTEATVKQWSRGEHLPASVWTWAQLCQVLDCSIDWLFGLPSGKPKKDQRLRSASEYVKMDEPAVWALRELPVLDGAKVREKKGSARRALEKLIIESIPRGRVKDIQRFLNEPIEYHIEYLDHFDELSPKEASKEAEGFLLQLVEVFSQRRAVWDLQRDVEADLDQIEAGEDPAAEAALRRDLSDLRLTIARQQAERFELERRFMDLVEAVAPAADLPEDLVARAEAALRPVPHYEPRVPDFED